MLLGKQSSQVAWVAPAPVRIFLPGVYYPEIWGLLPKPGNLGSFLIILFCFSDVIYYFFFCRSSLSWRITGGTLVSGT